jgi:HD superfamily phosphohydrolase YqeK
MNPVQLQEIKDWFTAYTGTFSASDGILHPVLKLKTEHSERVAENARKLAESLQWNPEEINRAEALGWLHDVGRFSQFSEFGTFLDSASINHGERGWEIIRTSSILRNVTPEEQNALLDGIRYHNAKTEPDHLSEESMRFLKLIRDADKLDIYRIVLDSVEQGGFQELPKMLPNVILNAPVSPAVLDEIQSHHSCSIEKVRSLADYLLLELFWIYDLNYPASLQLVSKQHIIDRMEQALPKSAAVRKLIQIAYKYIEENTSNSQRHPPKNEAGNEKEIHKSRD